jgi:ribonuclease BN (tRNA processing enzyme)
VSWHAAQGSRRVRRVAGGGPGVQRPPVERDGFRLLVDAGYATVPRLLQHLTADLLDAVLISHGHPDHCADLNPLAGAGHLMLTHLMPGTDHASARSAARAGHDGEISVAAPGLEVSLG